VHGFTSAFAVGVGIMALAAAVVITLIRPGNGQPETQRVEADEPELRPELVVA